MPARNTYVPSAANSDRTNCRSQASITGCAKATTSSVVYSELPDTAWHPTRDPLRLSRLLLGPNWPDGRLSPTPVWRRPGFTTSVSCLRFLETRLSPPVSASDARSLVPWAVEFRYDDVLDERLDRTAACKAVEDMRAWVDGLLGGPVA
jgi:hypothetical protein